MITIYNKSTEEHEKARKKKCPRCKNFGRIASDGDDRCFLCNGYGSLWISVTGSGWTRAFYTSQDESILY